MLRPAARIAQQIRLWDKHGNDDFVEVVIAMFDRWATTKSHFPVNAFAKTTKELMGQKTLQERILSREPT